MQMTEDPQIILNPDDNLISEISPQSDEPSSGGINVKNHQGARKWSVQDSIRLYNIDGWGGGYFAVNDLGNLTMLPEGEGGPQIEILDVIQEIERQNLELPCIIRFHDILRHRVTRINQGFQRTIQDLGYRGVYRGVYPVKVNQMKEVVEEILDAGRPYHYGLEAGSKAELQVVLAYNDDPEALTICNGYKDSEYIQLALLGQQIGRKVIIVIEKFSELQLCLDVLKESGIKPRLGIRAKLSSLGAGKWQESGGEHAKFGLTTSEILRAIDFLKEHEMFDCLELFHFHIGSQIPDIRSIKSAVSEGARLYANLVHLGAPMRYLDVGGGLGVDYDGSQSKSDFSVNYTLEEYINDVVYQVQQVCEDEAVPHPDLVSESGRAMVAAHSCVIMKVIDVISPSSKRSWENSPALESSEIVKETLEILKSLTLKNALESYHNAVAKQEEALSLFKLGHLSLLERSVIEQLVSEVCRWIGQNLKRMKRIPEEFKELKYKFKQQYVVNFSVFQSAPDHWAFDQLFPILPIHRLNERPKEVGILVDITCDSDGEIDRFIDPEDEFSPVLRLHTPNPKKPYYLGLFLTGAYQDIMGDMHNLFGRVNEVHVFSDDEDPEDFYIEEMIRGDTISDIVVANQYSVAELCRKIKQQVEPRVKDGSLKPRQGVQLVDFYTRLLSGYTYLRK